MKNLNNKIFLTTYILLHLKTEKKNKNKKAGVLG